MTKQFQMTSSQYLRLYGRGKIVVQTKVKSLRGRPSTKENPVMDSIQSAIGNDGKPWCKITLVGTLPGLNGSEGLIREHFMARKKRKNSLKTRLFLICTRIKFTGQVEVILKGYSSILSDWENFSAKFKLLGDVLVDLGIIEGDSPKTIIKFIPEQEKCQRKNARMEITIKQI